MFPWFLINRPHASEGTLGRSFTVGALYVSCFNDIGTLMIFIVFATVVYRLTIMNSDNDRLPASFPLLAV